ncbi:hypothetical protein FNAPI_6134 [Fusarium napiforme]|uniref:Uncharacterized protein n=1 Tax=Fusarium napiforme TaxID=42672 RepID=A0A8H5JHJ6_9HYPO|nr:hypothetical protein FNAPI_6134 [Fusarium napiforme]
MRTIDLRIIKVAVLWPSLIQTSWSQKDAHRQCTAPRHVIVPDSTILTPDTTHALGPSPRASPSTASTPGQRATRSDWQVGNALFDLQMKPFHAPDHGITVSFNPGPPQEVKVPAASLNPYRDGRIKTAVPSKLKGRTNMKQGNFSVMHMHIQKPQITERDLAAKLTSERTAAAAKLASAQGYRYRRRPRPPHTAAARNISQSLSNSPSVTADIHGPLSQPPPLGTVVPYEERRAETGSAQASARLEENPLTEPDSMEIIETEILAESTKGDVTPGVDHEQEDAPFSDASLAQDVSMNPSNEIAAPVDPTQEANREQSAITKLLTTILSPEEVRAEQYRLLELLPKLHPSTVVETLCSALTQFGGATRQPPSPHGESSESGSKKSSGDLFISWISEIFPPNFAENSTTKRPSKPSTGRPRGSALRTTFSLPELPYPTEEAASIMQGDATGSLGCTQENKTPTAAGSSVIIQGPQGPPSHPQDADLVSSKKRKNSQEGPCTNTQVIDIRQTSPRTAGLITNPPHETQVKRLRVSQETNPRNLGTSDRFSQSANAEALAFRSSASTRHAPSVSDTSASGVQAIGIGDSLSQQVPQSPSHLYQQDRGLKQFDESCQTQVDQGVQVQRKHQPRHHSSQDLRSEQPIHPTSLSSPTNTQSHSRDLVAPEDVLRKVTVVDLYQRQQRHLSNNLGHSAACRFPLTAGSSSHQQAQRLDNRPLVPRHRQQGLRRSTGTTLLANTGHFESHHRLEEPAQIGSMDETPSKPPETAIAPVANMS